jgi:hypothetical protein
MIPAGGYAEQSVCGLVALARAAEREPPAPGHAEFVFCEQSIERTFAWLGRYRRLSKDYEYRTETSEAMIYAAMAQLMARRLARW